jgi:hypothetical protein
MKIIEMIKRNKSGIGKQLKKLDETAENQMINLLMDNFRQLV